MKSTLKKLLAVNDCVGCDLQKVKAYLRYADLSGANLIGAKLRNAGIFQTNYSKAAVFCKIKTPWGLDNSDCKKAK